MIKTNLLKSSALALAILSAAGADAQTAIWGVGSSNTASIKHAEFQEPFIQQTTATYSDTAWTAVSISDDGGSNLPGNAYWIRSTGPSRGAFGQGSITVPANNSAANGVAMFDSDFLDNGGVQGAQGTGTSPSDQIGELVSPIIDLSAYADSAISVQFNGYWRRFQSNVTVSMSINNGLTWEDVNVLSLLPADVNETEEGRVSAPFFNITAVAPSALTQCRIRFLFSGEYYVFLADDISIVTAPAYDLAIRRADPSGNNLASAQTDIKVGGNRYIPFTQIDTADLKEWFFGAALINYGAEDLPITLNPKLIMRIDYTHPITGATTVGVYSDTLEYQDTTLHAGGSNFDLQAENLRDINFLCDIARASGDYDVTYWVEFDGVDSDPTNDTTRHSFSVTNDGTSPINSYLSKVRLNALGQPFAAAPTFPGEPTLTEFEYGSMFYFFKGATDAVKIDSIDFRYYIASDYSGVSSQTLTVDVYNWLDADASGTLDANGTELTQVALGVYTANGLGTTHAAGEFAFGRVTDLIDAATGGPVAPFIDNGFYLVTVHQNPGTLGGATTFTAETGLWVGRDELNYALNVSFTSGAQPLPNVSPAKVIEANGSGDWNWIGYGADAIPSIGLYIGDTSRKLNNNTVADVVYTDEGMNLSVFPNPANDVLNVNLELEEAANVTYVVTDIAGRVLTMATQNNVTVATSTIDVSALSAGVYFVTAKTDKKETTSKFVKK